MPKAVQIRRTLKTSMKKPPWPVRDRGAKLPQDLRNIMALHRTELRLSESEKDCGTEGGTICSLPPAGIHRLRWIAAPGVNPVLQDATAGSPADEMPDQDRWHGLPAQAKFIGPANHIKSSRILSLLPCSV